MIKKINLLIVDDHILFRKGLVELFNNQLDFVIVAEAGNGIEALKILNNQVIDVIVLDLRMPEMDGIDTLKNIRKTGSEIPILILSISDDPQDVISAILGGVNGYILKSEDFEILTTAIKNIYFGKKVISNQLLGILFDAVKEKVNFPVDFLLSKREMDVLNHLAEGKLIDQIATSLYISENTVKTHLKHIYEKLNVNNRSEAVKKSLLWGLIK